jgi:hypothetical protein
MRHMTTSPGTARQAGLHAAKGARADQVWQPQFSSCVRDLVTPFPALVACDD